MWEGNRGNSCEQTAQLKINTGGKKKNKLSLLLLSHGTNIDRLSDWCVTFHLPPAHANVKIKRSAGSDVHISVTQLLSAVIRSNTVKMRRRLKNPSICHRQPSYLNLKPKRLLFLFLQDHNLSEIKKNKENSWLRTFLLHCSFLFLYSQIQTKSSSQKYW